MAVKDIFNAAMEYADDDVAELVQAEIDAGTDVRTILDEGLIAALDIVGEKFSNGILFVPDMLLAADAVQAGLDILQPLLVNTGVKPIGTVVLGTVRGDLHDIGKNLVGMMLEGAGFRVIDLGTDIDPERFIDVAQENDANIIAVSSLLTTTMSEMARVAAAIRDANNCRNLNIKILVGGPPVTQEFADKIGADGYGLDAPAAVEQARGLV